MQLTPVNYTTPITTTHQKAIWLYNIGLHFAEDRIKPTCPAWVRERIMTSKRRAELRRAAKRAVAECTGWDVSQLQRDFRGWMRDGRRLGPGSGRRADWLDSGFARLSCIAQAVHALGYRDDECRRIAHVLHRWGHPQGWDVLPERIEELAKLPVDAPITTFRPRGYYSHDPAEEEKITRQFAATDSPTTYTAPEHVQRWILFLVWTPGL